MSFPLVISGILIFVKIPGMSDGFYVAWAFVMYILWGTLYSTVNIPYGSMAAHEFRKRWSNILDFDYKA